MFNIIFRLKFKKKKTTDSEHPLPRRINVLGLLSIESDILGQINCEDNIGNFINTKLRRKPIKD